MKEIEAIDVATLAITVGGYINGVPPLIGGGLPRPAVPALYWHPHDSGCSIERGGQGVNAGEQYDNRAACVQSLAREPMPAYGRRSRAWRAHWGGYKPE